MLEPPHHPTLTLNPHAVAPAALTTLLEGSVAYAGLFPPAALPLPDALSTYIRHRKGPYAWMLGPFVLPARELDHIGRRMDALPFEQPVPVVFISDVGQDGSDLLLKVRAGLARLCQVDKGHGLSLVGMEIRLPDGALGGGTLSIDTLIDHVQTELDRCGRPKASLFLELGSSLQDASAFGRALREIRWAQEYGTLRAGVKIRCGGVAPESFPTAERLADAVVRCRDAGVPLKATAGLHHPFCTLGADGAVVRHGFLNLFAAVVLAGHLGLSIGEVQTILTAQDAARFAFTDSALRVDDWVAPTEAIQNARRNALGSFGSCSFDEPIDDLVAAGFLPRIGSR